MDQGGLLEVLDELCEEVGRKPAAGAISPDGPVAEVSLSGWLSPEDHELIRGLRADLARLADTGRTAPGASVRGALDGAELVASSELLFGRRTDLPRFLPSFVFLAVLPLAGRAEALRLSRRATRLLEGAPAA